MRFRVSFTVQTTKGPQTVFYLVTAADASSATAKARGFARDAKLARPVLDTVTRLGPVLP